MQGRRSVPVLPFVLVVLLLLGATPLVAPAAADDVEPFQLSLIAVEDSGGVTSIPADEPFYIRHASALPDECVDGEPTQEALDDGSLFELYLDGERLVGEPWFECVIDDGGAEVLLAGARHDFVDGLSAGTYEFTGTWSDPDPDVGVYHDVAVTVLAGPIAIQGVVTDQETGEPIGGATIHIFDPSAGSGVGQVKTGDDGSYQVAGLDAGDYEIQLSGAPGYQDPPGRTVAYDGSTVVEVDITLIPLTAPADVTGTVTDARSGEPLIGAEVSLFWEDDGPRIPSVPTDEAGSYAIRGVDQGRAFRLRVIAPWQLEDFPGWDAAALVSGVRTFDGSTPVVIDLAVEPKPTFDDVPDSNTHAGAISAIVAADITLGFPDGTYRPGDEVTRGQMASFIARTLDAAGHILPSPDHTFTDIGGNTHEQAIGQLAAADIVLGRTPTDYAPARTVSRDQMASYLVRAIEWAQDTTYTAPKSPFTDIAGNTHEQAIDLAYELGLTNGRTETTYEPRIDVRRDQMASFLMRLLPELATAEGAIIIQKEVVGEFDGDPFEFTITCGGFSDTFRLEDGETYEKRGLPGGVIVETDGDFELEGGTTCDITETNPQGAVTTITLAPADFVLEETTTIEEVWILADETRQATFTNTYSSPNG